MSRSMVGLLGLLLALPAAATDPPLVCFGAEPSWSVRLESADAAQLSLPDAAPVEYGGKATRNDPLRERVWRGRPVAGSGGDLVMFLRDAACSDGMSDTEHPVTARVSLADGGFLVGCCRVVAPATAFEGTTWRLVELPGAEPVSLAALSRGLTARFDAGRVAGFAGCNNFTGPYTRDGDRITFGNLAGTMMACSAEAMALERSFHAAIAGTHRVQQKGNRMTLTADTGKVLAFAAEPPATLRGSTWVVTGFNNGRQAVQSPAAGSRLTLQFGPDGALSGNAGCNSFRASWSADGNRLSIGPPATTRKFCGEDVMAQERMFLAALESVATWSTDGDRLDLHRADEARALTATRSAE